MHSLETGIIVSIAALFFFSFMSLVFLREVNISKEIEEKIDNEKGKYSEFVENSYKPERVLNIVSILVDKEKDNVGEDDEQS